MRWRATSRSARRRRYRFREHEAPSPLPRAYQWVDGSAYVNHVELVRKARGAEMPASFWTDPLVYQGGSDGFLGPREASPLAERGLRHRFRGRGRGHHRRRADGREPRGGAARRIRLVLLANDVSLRNLIPAELAKGFGFFQSKPATAFSPVAVTPDELGEAWRTAKLHLPLRVDLNGAPFGAPDAGVDMTFDFAELIAHAAKTRNLRAGTIVGSGTVSNRTTAPSSRAARLLHRRAAHARDHPRAARRGRRSSSSATPCGSRCWTPAGAPSSAPSSRASNATRPERVAERACAPPSGAL